MRRKRSKNRHTGVTRTKLVTQLKIFLNENIIKDFILLQISLRISYFVYMGGTILLVISDYKTVNKQIRTVFKSCLTLQVKLPFPSIHFEMIASFSGELNTILFDKYKFKGHE